MGIFAKPVSRNIFPSYSDQDAATNPESLVSEERESGEKNIDVDDLAVEELETMVKRRWINKFSSKFQTEALARTLGHEQAHSDRQGTHSK